MIEIGPFSSLQLGMDELAVSVDLKRAPTRGSEGERFDSLPEFENFCRQTDGLRRVISNHAVFNRYFGFHLVLLFIQRVRTGRATVKVRWWLDLAVNRVMEAEQVN